MKDELVFLVCTNFDVAMTDNTYHQYSFPALPPDGST